MPCTALLTLPSPLPLPLPFSALSCYVQAPKIIENASAVKPVGWGDDSPLEIPDPEAIKPDDWDDEEVSESIGC